MDFSSKKYIGILAGSFCVFIWGITFVSTKYLLSYFSSFEILCIRYLLAYASLWILSPRKVELKESKDKFLFLCAGFCGVTFYQFLENMAISYSNAGNVSIIVSGTPLFTAIIAQIFAKEKNLSFNFFLGFFIAMFGIFLVCFDGAVVLKLNPKGDFFALLASISWGFYSLFVSKINSRGYKNIIATRKIFFYALICMIPVAIIAKVFFKSSDANFGINFNLQENIARFININNWFNLFFLGFFASALCFMAWSFACRSVGTVKMTVGIYLIPAVTIVFAFFALGEKLTPKGIIGTLLTICGLIISQLPKVCLKKKN